EADCEIGEEQVIAIGGRVRAGASGDHNPCRLRPGYPWCDRVNLGITNDGEAGSIYSGECDFVDSGEVGAENLDHSSAKRRAKTGLDGVGEDCFLGWIKTKDQVAADKCEESNDAQEQDRSQDEKKIKHKYTPAATQTCLMAKANR